MKSHLERAKANERFLAFIDDNEGDDFSDWKMTVLFYCALHYLKAFLILNKKPLGHSHTEIDSIINPCSTSAKFPFPQKIYDYYNVLYQNSWEARYSGVYFTDLQVQLLKWKCNESSDCLKKLKEYFITEGLQI